MERNDAKDCYRLRRMAILVFAVIFVYAMSVGPAIWCAENGLISERAYESAYLPLSEFASTIPPLYWLLDEYACFFQGLGG
jgi:hypothetical protein